MKMFLTRLGYGSKAVITGDVTQIDLPAGKSSGLKDARVDPRRHRRHPLLHFTERDVVRHRLVQDIISAYDRAGAARSGKPRGGREWRCLVSGTISAKGIDRRSPRPEGERRLLRRSVSATSGAEPRRSSTMPRSIGSTAPTAARIGRPTCSPSRCAKASRARRRARSATSSSRSTRRSARRASTACRSPTRCAPLLVHGILHLLGYDHETLRRARRGA